MGKTNYCTQCQAPKNAAGICPFASTHVPRAPRRNSVGVRPRGDKNEYLQYKEVVQGERRALPESVIAARARWGRGVRRG